MRGPSELVEVPHGLPEGVPSSQPTHEAYAHSPAFRLEQFRLDCPCNSFRYLVLDDEDIGEIAIVSLGPDVRSSSCVSEPMLTRFDERRTLPSKACSLAASGTRSSSGDCPYPVLKRKGYGAHAGCGPPERPFRQRGSRPGSPRQRSPRQPARTPLSLAY